jgi:N utilization substance protein A
MAGEAATPDQAGSARKDRLSEHMNKEILTVVDVVSNEKGVGKDVIFEALEAALASATKKRYTADIDVRVAIDRSSGDYEAFRRWEVIDPVAHKEKFELDDDDPIALEFPDRQIWLEDAKTRQPGIGAGDFVEEPLQAADFGRIAAQSAPKSWKPSRAASAIW